MPELNGQIGELSFTVHITRADTGKTETHQLVGKCTEGEAIALGATIIKNETSGE